MRMYSTQTYDIGVGFSMLELRILMISPKIDYLFLVTLILENMRLDAYMSVLGVLALPYFHFMYISKLTTRTV